jgi:hypothetical protein
MPRDRLTFRQRDVTAAIKAAERAGHVVRHVKIGQDGSIEVEMASSAANEATPNPEPNPWDEPIPADYWKRKPKGRSA